MAHDGVERWNPVLGLAERPATIFNISWQGGEQRLIVTVRYASDAGEGDGVASAVVTFEDVVAFQICGKNMELSTVTDGKNVLLNIDYPYGGALAFP